MTKRFGEKIKHKRKLSGLSLQDLAAMVGRSKPYIYQIEEGLSDPYLSVVVSLSKALGLSLDYVLDSNYNLGVYPHDKSYCPSCEKLDKINQIITNTGKPWS